MQGKNNMFPKSVSGTSSRPAPNNDVDDKNNGYMAGAGSIDRESWIIGREAMVKADMAAYRKSWGHEDDGLVVVSPCGVISGWMNEEKCPDHFVAGCRAFDINGNQWLAVGGDDQDGAEKWEKV